MDTKLKQATLTTELDGNMHKLILLQLLDEVRTTRKCCVFFAVVTVLNLLAVIGVCSQFFS